ncbi:hypothetical protein [Palleronia abyssalis]|uniref:Uncharacterized protein n=1 Tax=Palleronia abyssalis TaxID=1501240 RepID=A0A2R8BQN1_9RHOB|nr:hypothetical protein [Palleronia abyssalis]SPJ22435.1 hypothetical protein PAA8504_00228 [Palleronia abyssalis]
MTVIRLDDEESGNAKAALDLADEQVMEMLAALTRAKDRIFAEEDVSDAEVRQRLASVQKSIQHVFDERKRFDELRKKHAGIVHDYAIDFDWARDEIGRRLDRLRVAKDAGGVPGEPV